MDKIDRKILDSLTADGRLSMSELAKVIGMSAPSVAERVRHLESRGVITGFTIEVNNAALGFALEALVRIKPRPGSLHIVEQMILNETRFTSCDKVTGEDCFVTRLALKAINELDVILDPFHEKAETNTSIVKSSPISKRLPE